MVMLGIADEARLQTNLAKMLGGIVGATHSKVIGSETPGIPVVGLIAWRHSQTTGLHDRADSDGSQPDVAPELQPAAPPWTNLQNSKAGKSC